MLSRSRPRPCTVQVRRVYYRRTGTEYTDWVDCRRYASVRWAMSDMFDALYDAVFGLSSADYHVRLVFADAARDITNASRVQWAITNASRVQWAISVIKRDQAYNSIGARLRRGEAMAV